MTGPNPNSYHPIHGYDKLIFLKNFIKSANVSIGEYSYFDDSRYGPDRFEEYNILYNYDSSAKLVMGKFCAIAAETRFIMAGNHKLDAISTYPFPVFGNGWECAYDLSTLPTRDIIVGHDVWFGYDSLILSGVKIGDGAIIAARAVVTKDVPAYSIVAGNPAKIVKKRFVDKDIECLQKIAWWNWPIEKISKYIKEICQADVALLERVAPL